MKVKPNKIFSIVPALIALVLASPVYAEEGSDDDLEVTMDVIEGADALSAFVIEIGAIDNVRDEEERDEEERDEEERDDDRDGERDGEDRRDDVRDERERDEDERDDRLGHNVLRLPLVGHDLMTETIIARLEHPSGTKTFQLKVTVI